MSERTVSERPQQRRVQRAHLQAGVVREERLEPRERLVRGPRFHSTDDRRFPDAFHERLAIRRGELRREIDDDLDLARE